MKVFSTIYNIAEWVTKFAFLNILWIFFTLTGIVIFGFFPATTAMFAIIRQWLTRNTDFSVSKTFWSYYKNDFFKSNLLGIAIVLILLIIRVDFFYIKNNYTGDFNVIIFFLFASFVLFLLFLLYIFPVYVHFDIKIPQIIKHTFYIMLISPLHSLLLILSLAGLYVIFTYIPALLVIFGGSFSAFVIMVISFHTLKKIGSKTGR